MINKKYSNYWFTLVELIVTITILAILWTISFLALQWYFKSSRDSKRINDIKNLETSLELFAIDAWKYPMPDNSWNSTFSWELVWIQWFVWDNLIRNLSKSLSITPKDPTLETEYIYSVTNNRKEFQIMSLRESDLISSNLIMNITNASDWYEAKVYWNFNEVFINTDNYFVPIPSIITSKELPLELTESWAIESLVVNDCDNMPDLWFANLETETWSLDVSFNFYDSKVNKYSSDEDKILAVELIQSTFSWSSLASKEVYEHILSVESDYDKLELANWMFWWNFKKDWDPSIVEIIDDIIESENPVWVDFYLEDWTEFSCDLCD